MVLPYLSPSKSPQAVMGTLLKGPTFRYMYGDPSHVFHVCVMPCYDKKLEASRSDHHVPGTSVPEVDSVLTSGELY